MKPTPLPHSLTINKTNYPIRILYQSKKNSSASIKDGEIILRIAKHLGNREKRRHIESLLKRIKKRIDKGQGERPWESKIEDGAILNIFGQRYMIHRQMHKGKNYTKISIHNQSILIKVANNQPACPTGRLSISNTKILHKKIRRRLAVHFQDQLTDYIHKMNQRTIKSGRIKTIRFKEQSARWGSCTSNGNINISSRLIFMPEQLLEYVCLHEICHLKHPNHSPRFWQLVEKHMPNCKEKKKELRSFL